MQSFLAPPISSASFAANQHHVISLVGNDWTLSNRELNISVPASLPSQAHLNLHAAGVINDPLFELNEFDLRWVANNNWTYTSHAIKGLSHTASSTWLQFDGLDTFTSIYFCGQFVAYTDNQFRQYVFDITDILQHCAHEERILSLNFGSATVIANATARAPGQETFPDGLQFVYEFDNAYYIRKEQSDFGWDWGPALSPSGPWRPAYIIQLGGKAAHIRNSDIDIYRDGQLPLIPPDQNKDWVINASLDYFGSLPEDVHLTFVLDDASNHTITSGSLTFVNKTLQSITGMTTIPRHLVQLWWPNGLGKQPLYHLKIYLMTGSSLITSTTKRIGFRTIVLNMSPVSTKQLAEGVAPGNNWKFEINGHEFYAMGSNFIPPDPFWPTVTEQRMAQLFDSVVEGNQNMLRVWSSGAYSPDFIYDLADERGILLWSEFEFGDHLYPVGRTFLDTVREEAEYNVRRVNHHPSLALWAGGNELESLILQNIVKSKEPDLYDHYVGEFERLFIDVLAPAVFANTRSISYTPSSTGNGWLTLNFSADPLRPFTERYLNLTAGSVYGDTDFYNYDPKILGDTSKYPIGRFSNEFGFLSLPSVQSWQQQVSDEQLYFRSPVTTLRCHHNVPGGLNTSNFDAANAGYDQMVAAVETWYPTPQKTERIANFSAWVYATQVFQADLYRSQISFYRRGSGMPERQLGSLYWQLEDQWVAPTWASIEYDGRWKMLHYIAKDIYEPVIIAPFYNSTTGDLRAYVTSSLWEEVHGSAAFTWYDWSGKKLDVEMPSNTAFTVGALNTTKVLHVNTTEILRSHNIDNAVLRLEIHAVGCLPNIKRRRAFRHEQWFHAGPLRQSRLGDPGLQLNYDKSTQNFTVTATAGVAAWVFVDYPAGALVTFDANGFWLAAGQSRQLSYTVKTDDTNGRWRHGVTVQSMWNLKLAE